MLQCYVLTCGRSVTAFPATPRSQRPGQVPRSPHPKAGPAQTNAQYMDMVPTQCAQGQFNFHCLTAINTDWTGLHKRWNLFWQSCTIGTGHYRGQSGRGVALTIHPHLVLRFSVCALMAGYRMNFIILSYLWNTWLGIAFLHTCRHTTADS
jgi:hypothetical protein